ncbi:hypothetical protein SAMN05421753_1333 [Planctomicrobium piriforme]|uniref:Uncharacterized protein n=1 Tax=Planctomicrobium piriforme TaxID=1576369 RepID=A0A1I3TP37_9PLAN|nr:hypothetical protein SAMN05421753_1333 [Planctomicrobium piriforme]
MSLCQRKDGREFLCISSALLDELCVSIFSAPAAAIREDTSSQTEFAKKNIAAQRGLCGDAGIGFYSTQIQVAASASMVSGIGTVTGRAATLDSTSGVTSAERSRTSTS